MPSLRNRQKKRDDIRKEEEEEENIAITGKKERKDIEINNKQTKKQTTKQTNNIC